MPRISRITALIVLILLVSTVSANELEPSPELSRKELLRALHSRLDSLPLECLQMAAAALLKETANCVVDVGQHAQPLESHSFDNTTRGALTELYRSANGAQWRNRTNWLSSASVCSWFGVSCNSAAVPVPISLNLTNNNLFGALPSGIWSALASLSALDLSVNALFGPLPAFAPLVNLLELDLRFNRFNATVPSFDTLVSLRRLTLSSNTLAGTLPSFSRLVNLEHLDLENNMFTGTIPSFAELVNLRTLNLRANRLQGTIPAFRSLVKVEELVLRENQLSGPVPQLDNCTSLLELDCALNALSGTVPSFTALTSLRFLNLRSNGLSGTVPLFERSLLLEELWLWGNALSGTLPAFEHLVHLKVIDFMYNQLVGTIPDYRQPNIAVIQINSNLLTGTIPAFSTLTKLWMLAVDGNQLTGTLPSFQGLQALEQISVSVNLLTGTIPAVSDHPVLWNLNLCCNQFNGTIPTFRSLPKLHWLLLHQNRLTGTVPTFETIPSVDSIVLNANQLTGTVPSFDTLANLAQLQIANNSLTGTLPTFSLLKRLTWLVLSGNRLTGTVPAFDSLTSLVALDLSNNDLQGTLPSFGTHLQFDRIFVRNNRLTALTPLSLPKLTVLDVSANLLSALPRLSLPLLRTLDVSLNLNLTITPGWLLDALPKSVTVLDLAWTKWAGSLPRDFNGDIMRLSVQLQVLDLSNTNFNETVAEMLRFFTDPNHPPVLLNVSSTYLRGLIPWDIALPGVLRADDTNVLFDNQFVPWRAYITPLYNGSRSGDSFTRSYTCPGFEVGKSTLLIVSPTAYNYSECVCNNGYFGTGKSCSRCDRAAGCNCSGTVVQNCFPDSQLNLIPCLESADGLFNPCNPAGKQWFFTGSGDRALDGWCAEGHRGRLCSGCKDDFYLSGRRCRRCWSRSEWWLWLLWFLAVSFIFIGVVVFLYRQSASGTDSANPTVKTLVFHAQQLGILLSARPVLPTFVVRLLSTMEQGSSLTSLLSLDCLPFTFGLWERVVASLSWTLVLCAAAALLTLRLRWESQRPSDSDRVQRLLAVVLGLINFTYLPCSLAVFSAIGCTDNRETPWHLNMFSWQACDQQWASSFLPVCVPGVSVYLVILPLALWFYLGQQSDDDGSSLPSLLRGYRQGCFKWEAVMMARRLLFVCIVALVPHYKPILPLAFFLVLQFSVLLQHRYHPYANTIDNVSELASLYILMVNFFSGLLLRFITDTSMTPWMVVLLIINVTFLLLLLSRVVMQLVARDPSSHVEGPRCECCRTLCLYFRAEKLERAESQLALLGHTIQE